MTCENDLAGSDKIVATAQVHRRGHRGSHLTAGTTKRLFTLTAALCVCLTLGACGSVSGFVSDTWPTWAGGMPKDVPPRPGAPGYEEFIAHQQRQDAASNTAAVPGAAPGTTAAAAPAAAAGTTAAVPAPAVRPPAGGATTPPLPPAYARPDDRSATQGGLY
jgi:hypothetical protein